MPTDTHVSLLSMLFGPQRELIMKNPRLRVSAAVRAQV